MSKHLKVLIVVLCCHFLLIVNKTDAQQSFVKHANGFYYENCIMVDSFYYAYGRTTNDRNLVFTKFDKYNNVIFAKKYKGIDINGFNFYPQKVFHVFENGQNVFLLTGITNNFVNDSSIFNYPYLNRTGYIVKVNEQGATLWQKIYEQAAGFELCLANDSNYVFACAGYGGIVMKVDRNTGDTLWLQRHKEYNPIAGNVYGYFGGIYNNGNGYTISGYWAPNRGQFCLSKTDTMGNLIWVKQYGDTASNVLWSMVMTHDSGYVLIGQSAKDFADQYPWTNYMLIRTDANGDTLWCRTYDIKNGVDVAQGIVETNDFGFVVSGYSIQYDSLWNYVWPIVLIKVDSLGNFIWANEFATFGSTEINLSKTETGYLFVKQYINQTDTNGIDCQSVSSSVTMHYPLIKVTDSLPNGSIFGPNPSTLYYREVTLPMDTIAVTITDYCINTSISNIVAANEQLQLYPNPASNQLTITRGQLANGQVVTITVYDVLSKVQLEQKTTAATINVSTLAAGIYMLQIQQGDKVFNGRFVKE